MEKVFVVWMFIGLFMLSIVGYYEINNNKACAQDNSCCCETPYNTICCADNTYCVAGIIKGCTCK